MSKRKTILATTENAANSQDNSILDVFRDEAETALAEECTFRLSDESPDTPSFYGLNHTERILVYFLTQRANHDAEADDQTPEPLQWAAAMEEFAGRIREAFGQPVKRAV